MIGQIIEWLLGPLGVVLGGLAAIVASFFAGHKKGKTAEELKALRKYKETRDAMDAVERGDDPAAARERLRNAGKS